MRYAVFSIDDSRRNYTDAIRKTLDTPVWDEVVVDCVDGRDPEQLKAAQAAHRYEIVTEGGNQFPKVGQLGIWYSLLSALEHAPIVTFEDDALLMPHNFEFEFHCRTEELPEDFDFFSLFLPRDSDHMYRPERHNFEGGLTTCRVYQSYGGVSMYFSEAGAANFKRLIQRDGLMTQWDNQIYQYARNGELKGFTSMPMFPDLVWITGHERSIVQETEYLNAG